MRAKKAVLLAAFALVSALAIAYPWKPVSYVDQLIRVQSKQELGHIDPRILDEPVEVQAQLLDYASDKELVLKAWIALVKYPEMARVILVEYGAQPEFKEILRSYGEPVIPVIHYFRENNVWSVVIADRGRKAMQAANELAGAIVDRMRGKSQDTAQQPAGQRATDLGPNERGWHAIGFIKNEGHDLLGQFTVAPDKTVKWNQTDRVVKAVTSLFTSGIRNLETRYDIGNAGLDDFFWAGLDVALVAAPLKLLRSGKLVATSGKAVTGAGEGLNVATRTRLFAPRLLLQSRFMQSLGRYSLMAATVYVVVTHPGLISSLLAEAAQLAGVNPLLAQIAGWFLILWIVAYPFLWCLKALSKLILVGISMIEGRMRHTAPTSRWNASIH